MRTQTIKNIVGAALIAALLAPAAGFAQAYGRVALWVKDIGGNPIQGAKVTATCDQLPKFLAEAKTNKKGLAKLAFVDATKIYKVTVEMEGYAPMSMPVKAELRTTTDQFVELAKLGEQAAPSGPATRRFTPSERVFNEGVGLLGNNDLDAAEAKFIEALEMNPELAPAHAALAALALERKNFDGAIAKANEFLALSPEDPSGYYTLYEAYRQKGDQANADLAFEKFLSLDTTGDSAKLLYNQGVEAVKKGQLSLAKNAFDKALVSDPNLAAALLGLAKVHLDLGENEMAVSRADEFLAKDPTHYVAQRARYEAYTAMGDTANADDAFAKLVAHHPKEVSETLYRTGVDLFNQGKAVDAIANFERALAANPEFAKVHYHLALSLINANQGAEAKKHLNQFLAMAPEDPDAGAATEMLKYVGN